MMITNLWFERQRKNGHQCRAGDSNAQVWVGVIKQVDKDGVYAANG